MRVLDGQGDGARPGQGADGQVHALGDAVHHHQLLGGDVGGPHPAEVGGQLRPELGDAAGVGVAQRLVRQLGQDLAHRRQPGPARERGQVRRANGQVVGQAPGRRRRRRGAVGGRRRRHGRDPGARALAGHEEALGDELLVGLDDDPAAGPQVAGELAAGRQPDPGGQPSRADGRPQLGRDLVGQVAGGPVDPQLQVRQMDLYSSG